MENNTLLAASKGTDNDQTLLDSWRAGNNRSGSILVQRYMPTLAQYFANKVNHPEDRADLVHQTFLACISTMQKRPIERANFRAFLFGVATNIWREYLRKCSKRKLEDRDYELVCMAELTNRSPSSLVMNKRKCQAFVDGLHQVPISDQIVLEYRYFFGFSAKQIAGIMNIPAATARGQLMRARNRLQKSIHERLNDQSCSVPAPSYTDLENWSHSIRSLLMSK